MFKNPFKKTKVIANPSVIHIQTRSANPNDMWWVTLEYVLKNNNWVLTRQYESAYDPTYPSPGCSLDYQFHDDFAMALLNCIERRNKQPHMYIRDGHYKYQLYLTNGHGQVLRWFERNFTVGDPEKEKREAKKTELENKEIMDKISNRRNLRRSENYAKADEIRKELEDMGVILEDKPDGTTEWRRP